MAWHQAGLPREKWSDLRERFWLNMNLGFGGIYEPRKTKTPEQIINCLREAEVLLSQGLGIPEVCKRLGIS
ncbi:MAG: hypothetical protein VCF08_12685, partial [Alphaproteobacteria bacterium]